MSQVRQDTLPCSVEFHRVIALVGRSCRARRSRPPDLINLLFNILSVSSFYLAFFFLIDSSISGNQDPFGGYGKDIFEVFNKVYIALM